MSYFIFDSVSNVILGKSRSKSNVTNNMSTTAGLGNFNHQWVQQQSANKASSTATRRKSREVGGISYAAEDINENRSGNNNNSAAGKAECNVLICQLFNNTTLYFILALI